MAGGAQSQEDWSLPRCPAVSPAASADSSQAPGHRPVSSSAPGRLPLAWRRFTCAASPAAPASSASCQVGRPETDPAAAHRAFSEGARAVHGGGGGGELGTGRGRPPHPVQPRGEPLAAPAGPLHQRPGSLEETQQQVREVRAVRRRVSRRGSTCSGGAGLRGGWEAGSGEVGGKRASGAAGPWRADPLGYCRAP